MLSYAAVVYLYPDGYSEICKRLFGGYGSYIFLNLFCSVISLFLF